MSFSITVVFAILQLFSDSKKYSHLRPIEARIDQKTFVKLQMDFNNGDTPGG